MVDPSTITITSGIPRADWPPYDKNDLNSGQFMAPGYIVPKWQDRYVDLWWWSDDGGVNASKLQYTGVMYHVVCPTCKLINTLDVPNPATTAIVHALPNPADEVVNLEFRLQHAATVAVSLTDLLGRAVSRETQCGLTGGRVQFKTSDLPSDIYLYTVATEANRIAGRVLVTH